MVSENKNDKSALIHQGGDRSAPYPVSRLAPSFGLVDLARDIEQADQIVSSRLSAELRVIAEQVKSLQAQARNILQQARDDQRLNHARCGFRRIPGRTYHLYEDPDGTPAFSMLSPNDWQGQPPKPFIGSYRLENDMSWTSAGRDAPQDDSRRLVQQLLSASEAEPD